MRTALPILPAVVLLALVPPGHADPRPLLRQEVTIAVWRDPSGQDLKAFGRVALHAQAEIPGLVVTVRPFPTARARAELECWTSSDSIGYPDVVLIPDKWLPMYAHGLQPLNALLSARDLRGYPESVKDRLRCSDTLFGVPWTGETQALFYRADLFRRSGVLPPRTWDELVIAARRCHSPPDVYGFGLPGIHDDSGARLLLQLFRSEGADLPPVHRPSALNLVAMSAALSRYAELHPVAEPEVLAWDGASLENYFADGRLAMVLAPKSFEKTLAEYSPELEWATAPVPAGRETVAEIQVDVACILKTTRHRDAAVKLLKVLATRDSAALRLKLGGIPLEESLARDYRLDPAYAAYVATLKQARGIPVVRWPGIRPNLSDALFYLLTGRMSVAEAAQLLQATPDHETVNRPRAVLGTR